MDFENRLRQNGCFKNPDGFNHNNHVRCRRCWRPLRQNKRRHSITKCLFRRRRTSGKVKSLRTAFWPQPDQVWFHCVWENWPAFYWPLSWDHAFSKSGITGFKSKVVDKDGIQFSLCTDFYPSTCAQSGWMLVWGPYRLPFNMLMVSSHLSSYCQVYSLKLWCPGVLSIIFSKKCSFMWFLVFFFRGGGGGRKGRHAARRCTFMGLWRLEPPAGCWQFIHKKKQYKVEQVAFRVSLWVETIILSSMRKPGNGWNIVFFLNMQFFFWNYYQ